MRRRQALLGDDRVSEVFGGYNTQNHVMMKLMEETLLLTNFAPGYRRQELKLARDLDVRGLPPPVLRTEETMRELPWSVPYLVPLVSRVDQEEIWAFHIWFLVRVASVLMRRQDNHPSLIAAALRDCRFYHSISFFRISTVAYG